MATHLTEAARGLCGRLADPFEALREARVAGKEAETGTGGNSLQEDRGSVSL